MCGWLMVCSGTLSAAAIGAPPAAGHAVVHQLVGVGDADRGKNENSMDDGLPHHPGNGDFGVACTQGACFDEGLEQEIGRAQSELQSLMRISYAVFCLKKKKA